MASDDDAAAVPAAVEHIEGTSYEVAYGDPARFPLPGSENYYCREFPAAGGENPYQPEMGLMAPLVTDLRILESAPSGPLLARIGNALCVSFYDTLRRVPERSRGLAFWQLLNDTARSNADVCAALTWLMNYDRQAPGPGGAPLFSMICLVLSFYRMCHRDGTLQAFTERQDVANLSCIFDIGSIYFNLSARERERLREHAKAVRRDRRMPHILSRELMKKKLALESELSAEAEIGAFVFMTESNDLWRVVVSFL